LKACCASASVSGVASATLAIRGLKASLMR
jgi:hypothetical protein